MPRVRRDAPTSNSPVAETALVNAARAGDLSAFDRLVDRYQRQVVSVSYRLLGNLHDALEVSQDAFLRAYRSLASLSDPQRFGSWLLRIVVNLSLNFRRDRAARGRAQSLEAPLGGSDEPPAERLADSDPVLSPAARLQAEELRAALQRELEKLTPSQRVALVLFAIEQMPQREVAEIMGCSVEAVKWHVFQARKHLRERLAEFFEDQ